MPASSSSGIGDDDACSGAPPSPRAETWARAASWVIPARSATLVAIDSVPADAARTRTGWPSSLMTTFVSAPAWT